MMEIPVASKPIVPASRRAGPWALAALAALVLVTWLWKTPPGLLGKADAVGYAICHRIDERSFHLGSRALPLCARCTGTFLGVVLGGAVMVALKRGRAGKLSPLRVLLVLAGFVGVMGVDGVNSYLSLLPGLPHLYPPQNWLRLTTGMLEGLALVALIFPIFNQTMWKNWEDRYALANFRELGLMVALAAGLIGLVLSGVDWILYPLALVSAAGVWLMLTVLDTLILLLVTRHENRAENWKGALLPLLAGGTLALLQIALVDAARFAIFQSWGGLVLPR